MDNRERTGAAFAQGLLFPGKCLPATIQCLVLFYLVEKHICHTNGQWRAYLGGPFAGTSPLQVLGVSCQEKKKEKKKKERVKREPDGETKNEDAES